MIKYRTKRVVPEQAPVSGNYSLQGKREAYLVALFGKVSRTFALTIPELPLPLRRVVMNAYLLARAADTIEDDIALTLEQKNRYGTVLIEVIAGKEDAEKFSLELAPLLSMRTPEAERELIEKLPWVIDTVRTFSENQQQSIERCIRIMWNGMYDFLQRTGLKGLETSDDLYRYCYHAAGVVGEMLTELFCDYSPEMAKHEVPMKKLAISFGRGLQITNILYDHWEDRKEGLCWLPRDIYEKHGVLLDTLEPQDYNAAYKEAQSELQGRAHAYLCQALRYTLFIPASEPGIRRFCYWTVYLSVLALQRMSSRPYFSNNAEVKVPRIRLLAMIIFTRLFGVSDTVLKRLFSLATKNIPLDRIDIDKS
jgi:farnesyl-diphosphate farnesyltransferase